MLNAEVVLSSWRKLAATDALREKLRAGARDCCQVTPWAPGRCTLGGYLLVWITILPPSIASVAAVRSSSPAWLS